MVKEMRRRCQRYRDDCGGYFNGSWALAALSFPLEYGLIDALYEERRSEMDRIDQSMEQHPSEMSGNARTA